jgi:hypothetical protein
MEIYALSILAQASPFLEDTSPAWTRKATKMWICYADSRGVLRIEDSASQYAENRGM